MKRILFIMSCIMQSVAFSQTSKSQADALIQAYLVEHDLDQNTWLYSLDSIPDSILLVSDEYITVPSNSRYAYFLDEHPYANWMHSCKFLFVQANSDSIAIVSHNWPPRNMDGWQAHFTITEEGGSFNSHTLFSFDNNVGGSIGGSENCYAVIISGGIRLESNYIRYWNDCSAIYSVLTKLYGYKDENVYVLMSDGTDPGVDRHVQGGYDSSPLDLDGDGDDDIGYAATKADISIVFDELAQKMTSEDFLFIFTTDHGGVSSNGRVFMCLWGENIYADEFAAEVDKVKAGAISVVMEQCNSGGFIPALSKKGRVVATACRADENSWPRGSYTYNEFVYHWISAVASRTPDGATVDADTNDDGLISMKEAFDYALLKDIQSESPQYLAEKPHYGEFLTLLGNNLCSNVQVCNETYDSDATRYGCDVTISHVTVSNNAKLSIESMGSVTFNGPMTVQLGSVLELK